MWRAFFLQSLFCFLMVIVGEAKTLTIQGKVYNNATQKPIEGAYIVNIHSNRQFVTDSSGLFTITANEGELLEFRKLGYKISRVRLSATNAKKFYNIGLTEGAIELKEVEIKGRNHRIDSIKLRETYGIELNYYTLEGLDRLKSPFSLLDKKNKQIWAFQKNFQLWEEEKYVDHVFNEKTIRQLTNLGRDSMAHYRRLYRPSYEFVKTLNTYDFYQYIQRSVNHFRKYRTN